MMNEVRKRRQPPGFRPRNDGSESHPCRENYHAAANHNGRSKPTSNTKSANDNSKSGAQRHSNGDRIDNVRKIVQEEGRTARNLIQFNVPVEDDEQPLALSHRKVVKANQSQVASRRDTAHGGQDEKLAERGESLASPRKKGDVRARYWAFLFDNLRRAVDEIYHTCETDESVVECKEVIMMLKQCTNDFKSLIERLNLLEAYETAEDGNRPTSLAWELRKSSPGKGLLANNVNLEPSSGVARCLNYSSTTNSGLSWADRVRGVSGSTASAAVATPASKEAVQTIDSQAPHQPVETTPVVPLPLARIEDPVSTEDGDSEGWATVGRGGRTRAHTATVSLSTRSVHKFSRATSHETPASMSSHTARHTEMCERERHSEPRQLRGGAPSCAQHDSHTRARSQENVRLDTNQENAQDYVPCALSESMCDADARSSPAFNDISDCAAAHDSTCNTSFVEERSEEIACEADCSVAEVSDEFSSDDEKDDEEYFNVELTSSIDEALQSVAVVEASLATQMTATLSELEAEQQAALESAELEEQSYLRQIAVEQQTEIEVETEPDTEGEASTPRSLTDTSLDAIPMPPPALLPEMMEYERRQLSWVEMMEEEEAAEARTPGRVVHMHEKLSSPSRRRSPTRSRRRHEEKQAKAQELRQKLLSEKADRLRHLTSKVEEVRSWKEELLAQRRHTIECKMRRAEEKRQIALRQKVKKAHDEGDKANEIAFINTLEAANKRHDIIAKHAESEARLHSREEERQRRTEEKAAKEAAVEERRRLLEAERAAKLVEMQERQRHRETEFEARREEREKERHDAARAKERERESRLTQLNEAQQARSVELQKKIKLKQDEGARRYQENLEQIREKAFEMSIMKHSTGNHNDIPELAPYARLKYCGVCHVLITSELYLLSHLCGKKHAAALAEATGGKALTNPEIQDFNLKHIVDAPADTPDPRVASLRDRQRALRKRCKKLRHRMTLRGTEYENSLSGKQQYVESEHRAKLQKVVRDVQKYLAGQDRGPWLQGKVAATDRALGEIARILDKKFASDQNYLRVCGGLHVLASLLDLIAQQTPNVPPVIPNKTLLLAVSVMRLACRGCYDNCHFLLFSNRLGVIVDLLAAQLHALVPEDDVPQHTLSTSPMACGLVQLTACVVSVLARHRPPPVSPASAARTVGAPDVFMSRVNDIVSYTVSVGCVDRLAVYLLAVERRVDELADAADFVLHGLGLIAALTRLATRQSDLCIPDNKTDDVTQLVATLQSTELCGVVSLLYSALLLAPAAGGADAGRVLPQHVLAISTQVVRCLNHAAMLDLHMLQEVLSGEGMWLELRHMAHFLLQYCAQHTCPELLHELIVLIGYFTVCHRDNQATVSSGACPTILQQLCQLPFQYFSSPPLTTVLFPTLIACCYENDDNRAVLQYELSTDLLANFIEEKQLESQAPACPAIAPNKKAKNTDRDNERFLLANRLPVSYWSKAKDYFQSAVVA